MQYKKEVGVNLSYTIFVLSLCRHNLSLQIGAKKMGIGKRHKWIELSLLASLSKKPYENSTPSLVHKNIVQMFHLILGQFNSL